MIVPIPPIEKVFLYDHTLICFFLYDKLFCERYKKHYINVTRGNLYE